VTDAPFPAPFSNEENGAPAAWRATIFGIHIDCVTMAQAVAGIRGWYADPTPPCRYVVTPNVDHIVKLEKDGELQDAYRRASLVVADGWPIVAAARLLGFHVPERVAGSDLVPALLAAGGDGGPLCVFLLGAAPGVGARAVSQIEKRWPGVCVCGHYSPPIGFENDSEENAEIVRRINEARPHLLVVGLGSPKQENWLAGHADVLAANAAVAAGGTIDFLAGEQTRAPRWVRRLCLEWLFRACTAPRRLGRRYLHDAWVFPRLFVKEYLRSRKARKTTGGKRAAGE
jgi:N-acetylglucosaminyldiphosphoundecaprenol N-acetyl-beta-D-mannosaminyltransferase